MFRLKVFKVYVLMGYMYYACEVHRGEVYGVGPECCETTRCINPALTFITCKMLQGT